MSSSSKFVVLVTGDRNWTLDNRVQSRTVRKVIRSLVKYRAIIVHGAARGVDSMADHHAKSFLLRRKPHPADWDQYHKAAGPIRNQEMLDEENPDLVLAFHDDLSQSKGTKDMVNKSLRRGVKVMHITSDGTQREVTERIP